MAKQSRNQTILNGLVSHADELATIVSDGRFPIPVKVIAQRQGVTSVVFTPLLVDGMLTTHPAGFRIFLDAHSQERAELDAKYELHDGAEQIPVRLRFSLAHELAHTLFYSIADETRRPQLSSLLK